MSRFRPTVEEERWSAVAARLGIDRAAPFVAQRLGGWVRVGTATRVALFVLGTVAAALTAAIFSLLHLAGSFLVEGAILIGIAEWLIARRRLFAAGLEEALELAGLLMIVFQSLDGGSDPHFLRTSILAVGVFTIAGFRLLNPLFTTVAALLASYALSALGDSLGLAPATGAALAAAYCYAKAVGALALGARHFKRPSHDRMLDWGVIVMPLAGYLWIVPRFAAPITLGALRTAGLLGVATIAVPLVFGLAALLAGLKRHTHAPLLAALVAIGCIAYQLRELTGLALEWRLIVWGAVALALTIGLERYLRTPRRGITSVKLAGAADAFKLLPLLGAAALTPHAAAGAPAADPKFTSGGGKFGGGGASGDL